MVIRLLWFLIVVFASEREEINSHIKQLNLYLEKNQTDRQTEPL